MTISYSSDIKTDRMNAVNTRVGTSATIELCTTNYGTVLVSIPLNAAGAFSENLGVLTFLGVPLSGVAGADGEAAVARIKNSGGDVKISGLTVAEASGEGDVKINSTTVINGQTITIIEGAFSHSA